MSDDTPGGRVAPEATSSPKARRPAPDADPKNPEELPERSIEGRPKSPEAAEKALVRRKPQIGDTMPAPPAPSGGAARPGGSVR